MNKLLGVLAICALLGLSGVAKAAPILDQDNASQGQVGFCGDGFSPPCHWFQGVTSGASGTLAGINLWTYGSSSLTIYAGTPGSLGASLFSTTFSGGSPTFVDTSLANIALTIGQQFVLDVYGSSGIAGNEASYAGGELWLSYPYGYFNYNSFSLGFQTFMVGADVTVPAPGALALLGLGLLGFGGLRRKA